jgi:hypothetical protein
MKKAAIGQALICALVGPALLIAVSPAFAASPIGSAGAPPSRAILRTPGSRGQRSSILLPGRPRLGVTLNCAAERRTAS